MVRLDPDGNVVYKANPAPPGTTSGGNYPFAADSAGNAYVAVITAQQNCVLSKLDPNGNLVYTLPIPIDVCYPHGIGSQLAVGPDGSVFASGTALPGVPDNGEVWNTTPGAYVPLSAAARNQLNGFVVKVNPQGTAITFATFLDPAPANHNNANAGTTSLGLAVDSQGNAYVAGMSTDTGFPTTPGAFMPNCNCVTGKPSIFVLKLSADGSKPLYSTFINSVPFTYTNQFDQNPIPPFVWISVDDGSRAVVTQAQNVFILQPLASDTALSISQTTLDPSGTSLSSHGASSFTSRGQISAAPDNQGNLVLSGSYPAGGLPVSPGAFSRGTDFAAVVRIADGAILYSTRLPTGMAGIVAADGSGGFAISGSLNGIYPVQSTSIVRLVPLSYQPPGILGAGNAAGLAVSTGLVPGEAVSIYGVHLGPTGGISGTFDSTGNMPRDLAKTEVYFNGIQAPLFYADDQQVNAMTPFAIAGASTVTVTVQVDDVLSNVAVLPVQNIDPQIFKTGPVDATRFAPAAAVNQDGTVNTATNPAKGGAAVTVFVSGAGPLSQPQVDGQPGGFGPMLPPPPLAAALETYRSDGSCCIVTPATVLYAGSAPALVAGILQVNVLLPPLTGGARETGLVLYFTGTISDMGPSSAAGAIWVTGN